MHICIRFGSMQRLSLTRSVPILHYRLLLCKACLGARGKEHVQEAVDTLMEVGILFIIVMVFCAIGFIIVSFILLHHRAQLAQVESCDYHVTVSLFKACILQGDLDKASEVKPVNWFNPFLIKPTFPYLYHIDL